MTLIGLLVAFLVVCAVLYIARQLPAPFSYAVYAVVTVVLLVWLLSTSGIVGGPGWRLR